MVNRSALAPSWSAIRNCGRATWHRVLNDVELGPLSSGKSNRLPVNTASATWNWNLQSQQNRSIRCWVTGSKAGGSISFVRCANGLRQNAKATRMTSHHSCRSATIGSTRRRAARRDVAGDERHHRQQQRRPPRTASGSAGLDAEQLAAQQAGRAEARGDADDQADQHQPSAHRQHQAEDVAARGAERHAHAELVGAAGRRGTTARCRCRPPRAASPSAANALNSAIVKRGWTISCAEDFVERERAGRAAARGPSPAPRRAPG